MSSGGRTGLSLYKPYSSPFSDARWTVSVGEPDSPPLKLSADFFEVHRVRLGVASLKIRYCFECQPLAFFARVTGGEPPQFEDGKTDGSLAALKAQIKTTIERLQSAPASKFEGSKIGRL